MLCAMKEAADVEIKRLQDKLARFVDQVCATGPGKSIQQAVNLRRGILPKTPENLSVVFNDRATATE